MAHSREWNRPAQELAVVEFENAANQYLALNLYAEAIDCSDRAAKALETLGRRDQAVLKWKWGYSTAMAAGLKGTALTMVSRVAQSNIRNGAVDEGRRQLKEARRRNIGLDDNLALSSLLMAEAELARHDRDFDRSIAAFGEAADLRHSHSDQEGTAEALLEQGFDHMVGGEYDKGLTVLQSAMSIWSRLGSSRGEAQTNTALGHLYSAMSDHRSALSSYKAAEQKFPPDIDSYNRAILYTGLSNAYEELNDLPISIAYNERALEIFRSANNPVAEMQTLMRRGVLMHRNGNSPEGRAHLERSLELAKTQRDEHSQQLIKLMIGDLLSDTGENRTALDVLISPLKYFNQHNKIRAIARIETVRGEVLLRLGEHAEALSTLSRAIELHLRIRDELGAAEALFLRALVSESVGDFERARADIERSIELTEQRLKSVDNTRVRQLFRSDISERYELNIRLLMREPGGTSRTASEKALMLAERARAHTILEGVMLASFDYAADADADAVGRENELRRRLSLVSNELTDLLGQGAPLNQIEALDKNSVQIQHALEEVKAEIKQKSPVYSAIKDPPPFDVDGFQRSVLDDHSLLLEFSLGEAESYLWVADRHSLDAYVLPSRKRIEEQVEFFRRLLAARQPLPGESLDEHQRRIANAEDMYWPAAQELSVILLGPVAEKIKGKRLIVVPDGKLQYLPFSALPLPNSVKTEPLILTNEVVYQPSAHTLSVITGLARKTTAERDILLFSDPVFTADDPRLSAVGIKSSPAADEVSRDSFRFVKSLGSLPRLPGSGDEAESIRSIVGAPGVDSFEGFDATRDRLLSLNLADYKILHLATHGVVNNERPELSGMVLSRYGSAGDQLNEFIRLQDIYGMRLNADLVVLSACETGIGKEVRGEGMMSLNNAFLQSGAKSVLASLWKVEDGASQILMKEFYGGIASQGLTPSDALRKAQLKLAGDPRYSSPFYWAAFTLQGDYKARPALGTTYSDWAYAAPLVSIFLVAVYLLRRKLIKDRRA